MRSIFLVLTIAGLWGHTYACKREGPPTVEQSFKGAAVIVSGKVLSKDLVSVAETMNADKAGYVKEKLKADKGKLEFFESGFIYKIQLEIRENYKGGITRDILTIFTTITSGSCGFKFDVGRSYLVYASKRSSIYFPFLDSSENNGQFEKENTFWTNHCSRTTEYYSKSEIDELRRLKQEQ